MSSDNSDLDVSTSNQASTSTMDLRFPCPLCTFVSSSQSGLTRHTSSHARNPSLASVTQPSDDPKTCPECGMIFGSQIGLSLHRKSAHASEYNASCLNKLPKHRYNWSQLDDDRLLSMADKLWYPGLLKDVLCSLLVPSFPGRTMEAIKRRLLHIKWQPPKKQTIFPRLISQTSTPSHTHITPLIQPSSPAPVIPTDIPPSVTTPHQSPERIPSEPDHSRSTPNWPAAQLINIPSHSLTSSLTDHTPQPVYALRGDASLLKTSIDSFI